MAILNLGRLFQFWPEDLAGFQQAGVDNWDLLLCRFTW